MRPGLAYFKMSEAHGLAGEFAGWSTAERDERLRYLYSLIEEFASAQFSFIVRPDDLSNFFTDPKDHYGRHPFYFGADCLVSTIGRDIEKFGLPRAQVDFWFDNQDWEQMRFLAEADAGRKLALDNPPPFKVLHNLPNFADEKQVLPLQAADLFAWWERRRYVERLTGNEQLPYPWKSKRNIRGVRIEYNARQIQEYHAKSVALWRERGLIP